MATEKQLQANRTNAKRSTGPKTAAGKLKSSRNAIGPSVGGHPENCNAARKPWGFAFLPKRTQFLACRPDEYRSNPWGDPMGGIYRAEFAAPPFTCSWNAKAGVGGFLQNEPNPHGPRCDACTQNDADRAARHRRTLLSPRGEYRAHYFGGPEGRPTLS